MISATRAFLLLLGVFGWVGAKDANDTSSRVMLDGGRYVPMWRGRLDTVYGFSYFTPSLVQNSCQTKKGQQCSLIPGEYVFTPSRALNLTPLTQASRSLAVQELPVSGTVLHIPPNLVFMRDQWHVSVAGQHVAYLPRPHIYPQSFVLDPFSDNPNQPVLKVRLNCFVVHIYTYSCFPLASQPGKISGRLLESRVGKARRCP